MAQMSAGITPSDFVQQVIFAQEKVLLDLHPDDDVYREVLTEANLAIAELECNEDWHWLRQTVTLGIPRSRMKGHGIMHQHDVVLDIPSHVRKLSATYGDGIRLCRYRVVSELVGLLRRHMATWESRIESAQAGLSTLTSQLSPDAVHIYYSGANTSRIPVDGIAYGGTFATDISDSTAGELRHLIEAGHWYLDVTGHAYFGGTSAAKTYTNVADLADPVAVYVCEPLSEGSLVDVPSASPSKLTSGSIEPHNALEALHNRWSCWHPFAGCGLNVIFDADDVEASPLVEVFENDFIRVPIVSTGRQFYSPRQQTDAWLQNDRPNLQLGAVLLGDEVGFTRPLAPWEANRVALADAQLRIRRFHVCDHSCMAAGGGTPSYPGSPCTEADADEKAVMLTEVPNPEYLIWRTAERHCAGSPVSAARSMDLQNNAQKILSAMRQDNSDATAPDYMEWWTMMHLNVV